MKKYILAILVIAAALAGFYWMDKNNSAQAPLSTSESLVQILSKKINQPADQISVQVGADTGKFARGTYNLQGQPGGGVWFAAKTDRGWELAYDGNGIVTCDGINKYDFPKDMVPQCLDIQSGNLMQR